MSTSGPTRGAAPRRGGRVLRWVFLALLVVPMLEIAAIIAVGRTIGGWPTFVLLVVESVIGAVIVHREGSRAWNGLRDALRSGRMPSRQLADAALVLVGGTLLLTPGFITDAAGFFLVIPLTRPITRRWLEALVARRLLGPFGAWPEARSRPDDGSAASSPSRGPGDPPEVIQGEIVD